MTPIAGGARESKRYCKLRRPSRRTDTGTTGAYEQGCKVAPSCGAPGYEIARERCAMVCLKFASERRTLQTYSNPTCSKEEAAEARVRNASLSVRTSTHMCVREGKCTLHNHCATRGFGSVGSMLDVLSSTCLASTLPSSDHSALPHGRRTLAR